ncbi:MAG: hypothetical protein Q8R37_02315 [Nanoarchaeota archaeon]|nr:hypothetical protein [Nanoarchaeota archaeon]
MATFNGIDEILNQILTDEEIVSVFKRLLQHDEGFILGQTGYYDDTSVDIVYGITNVGNQIALFSYENNSTEMQRNLRFTSRFPDYSRYAPYFDGWIRPELLLESLVEGIKNPQQRIVQFYNRPTDLLHNEFL